MIPYSVVHHIPGRIRLEVPSIQRLSYTDLKQLLARIPAGIRDIQANPITGSVVIKYDPKTIDILAYIRSMTSSREMQEIVKKGVSVNSSANRNTKDVR